MNKKYEVISDCEGSNGLSLKAGEIIRVMSEESVNELIQSEKIKEVEVAC